MGFRASQLGGLFLEPQQLLPSPRQYHIAARFLQLLIRRGNTSVKCRLLSTVPGQLQCSVPQACCGAFPSLCASQDLLLTKKSLAVTVSLILQQDSQQSEKSEGQGSVYVWLKDSSAGRLLKPSCGTELGKQGWQTYIQINGGAVKLCNIICVI